MESSALLRVIVNIGAVDIIRCPDNALVWQSNGSLIWQSDKNQSSQSFAEENVMIAIVNLHIFLCSRNFWNLSQEESGSNQLTPGSAIDIRFISTNSNLY